MGACPSSPPPPPQFNLRGGEDGGDVRGGIKLRNTCGHAPDVGLHVQTHRSDLRAGQHQTAGPLQRQAHPRTRSSPGRLRGWWRSQRRACRARSPPRSASHSGCCRTGTHARGWCPQHVRKPLPPAPCPRLQAACCGAHSHLKTTMTPLPKPAKTRSLRTASEWQGTAGPNAAPRVVALTLPDAPQQPAHPSLPGFTSSFRSRVRASQVMSVPELSALTTLYQPHPPISHRVSRRAGASAENRPVPGTPPRPRARAGSQGL